MPLRIATWNLQRNHSGQVIEDCERIIEENPDTYFCFQEVTQQMGIEIARILSGRDTAHASENMIVAPAGGEIENPYTSVLSYKTRSFLHTEMPIQGGIAFLLTGKLRHGLSLFERRRVLQILYNLYRDVPAIFALDTNCIIPSEFSLLSALTRKHGFSSTQNPDGTYDMGRMEHRFGKIIPTKLARIQLDRILCSPHFSLKESRVRTDITSSDHEPVFASFRLKNS